MTDAEGSASPRGASRPLTSLPNLLGLARIAATPVVIALLLYPFPGGGVVAFVVFALAASTDFVDGQIARARGEVSPLGVFMDLTADKVLVAGVLVAMVEVDLLPTWLVALLLIRELVVQGVRQLAASADVVISSRRLGKGKTFATLLGMGLLLLAFDAATGGPVARTDAGLLLRVIGGWTMVFATALSVASGLGLHPRRAAAAAGARGRAAAYLISCAPSGASRSTGRARRRHQVGEVPQQPQLDDAGVRPAQQAAPHGTAASAPSQLDRRRVGS